MLLFLVCFLCANQLIAIARGQAYVAQITYSGSTLSPLYLASNLSIGTPPQVQQLLISTDAGTSHSWVKCGRRAPFDPSRSSTFRYATCGSRLPCFEALQPYNISGRLANDVFSLRSTNGSTQGALGRAKAATFACASAGAGAGAFTFNGVASLTASKAGLPAQLGVTKFAYCLPPAASSSPTPLFLGEGISYVFLSSFPVYINVSDYLAIIKLNVHPKTGYFSIGVNNVSVDSIPLSLTSPFKLRISTIEPFTKLPHHVYKSVRSIFRAKAPDRGMQPAPAQYPFDTCFNASTIGFSRAGPAVPVIGLDFAGEAAGSNVGVSLFGYNTIVAVSESVSCWAFLDAGAHKPAVLGSYQQQRNLYEFDLLNKRLGWSGVLEFYRTACSNFQF